MTSMKIVQFSRPIPLFHLHSKLFHPLDLGRPVSRKSPPLQMITNQLKEIIIHRWLLYVIRSFCQVGFHFQYQFINLVRLSFDFFWFSWSLTFCLFVTLYSSCVCSCPKISRNVFYLWSFTFLVLISRADSKILKRVGGVLCRPLLLGGEEHFIFQMA